MAQVQLEAAALPPIENSRIRPSALPFAGGVATFAIFAALGAIVLIFSFRTVNARGEQELSSHSGARRSHAAIAFWAEHGYFASGGLMSLETTLPHNGGVRRSFYRSLSGGYILSGYVVEKLVMWRTGQYSWRALAIHNEMLMLLTGALAALLVFRVLRMTGTARTEAMLLAAAVEVIFMTFPETLWQYWEIGPQMAALPFALLFLVLDHRSNGKDATRLPIALQALIAFATVYVESVFGIFFLVSYLTYVFLIDRRDESLNGLLVKTIVPTIVAMLVFAGQVSYVRRHFAGVPLEGSSFMFRTGLDGSTLYYEDHSDIIYGRDVARRNFPVNRPSLFNWTVLFLSGVAAAFAVIAIASIAARYRLLLAVMIPLLGGYALYAAVFSQAIVIHPYLYDTLLATPLIIALFAFLPAILESRFRTNGVILVIVLFATAWCAFVQMRHYAMWYPVSSSVTALHARLRVT